MISNSTILNKVYLEGTWDYQQRVPAPDVATQRETMQAILSPNAGRIYTEFVDALVRRIGTTIVHNKEWKDPFRIFRSNLPWGGSVQEVATKWIKAHSYNMDAQTLLKLRRPEMQAAYHTVNRADTYPISIVRTDLQQAALDQYGLNRLIDSIMQVPINSAEYDTYLQVLGQIAFYENTWGFYKITLPEPDDDVTAKDFLKSLKATVARLQFPSSLYNASIIEDIPVFAKPEELVLLVSPEASASVSVDGLATLFHLEPADAQIGRKIIIHEFPIDGAYAMLTTRDFFQIYDIVNQNDGFYNPETLAQTYFYQLQQIISVSPFVPAIVWTTETGTSVPTITQTVETNSVTLSAAVRSKNGTMSALTAGTELTSDMVTGKNPDDDFDGVFLFGQLQGSLSDGTITDVQELDGIKVAPDAYTVTDITFTAAEGETAPVKNSRTYIDRLGRLHLQAGAFKTAGGLTVTVTCMPCYINPDGATATPTASTYEFTVAGTDGE